MNLHAERTALITSALNEIQVVFFSCSSNLARQPGRSRRSKTGNKKNFFGQLYFWRLPQALLGHRLMGGECGHNLDWIPTRR
jgi:hypothetical protein